LDELRNLLQNGYSTGVLNNNINDVPVPWASPLNFHRKQQEKKPSGTQGNVLVNRQQNRPKQPITTVPQKEVFLILPWVTRQNPHQTNKGLQQ